MPADCALSLPEFGGVHLALPAVLVLQAVVATDRPADVVRQATHAVEVDSAGPALARWRASLARDSSDLGALLGVATITRLTYEDASADRLYARVAAATAPGSSYAAWAALGRAESRLYHAPLDSASAWFVTAVKAARSANDSVAVAQALFGLTISRLRRESAAVALPIVDSGLGLAPRRDPALVAQGRCSRAAVLALQGNMQAGQEALRGLALARQAGDLRRESFCLAMLGAFYMGAGDHARSAALLDTAVAAAQRVHDRRGVALALWWRGTAELDLYDHDAARRDLSAVLVEAGASGNEFIAAWAWLRLAVVSWHFGDMLSARRELERGRTMMLRQGDGWGLAYVRYVDGAIALDAGQVDAAEAAYRDDLARAQRLQLPLEQHSASFGLARVAMSRGDWTAARTHFGEAETVARAHGLMAYVPQLEYEYGVVALHEGNLVEAERRFRAMLASTSGVTDLDRYAARSRIAQIHVAQGDVARAERELIDATNAMDSLRAALNDRELRVLAFQAHKGYDETEVGFASIIAGLVAGARVDGALALVERRRARELLDHLARSGNGLTRERVTGFVVPTVPDQRTAVLEFVTGLRGEPTTLFVLSSNGTSALSRPPADSIAADIQAFSAMIEAGARADTLARRLGDAVFGSALESLPADVSRLVIIGDGPLQHLPFDAVRLRDGRYLVDRFALSLAPSAAVVADLHGRPRRDRGAPRILAFGDPRFANEIAPNGGSAADVYRDAFSMNGGLPRLRASADEAKLVARFGHQSELRLRERASESYLKHATLDSFAIVHLATHALVDERSVARTALAVAAGEGDDGFVGPGELSALRLDAGLVVLSACRTARGVAVRGEGVQGLTAPLLAAGARSVLATQWRIRDTDAVQFIDDFYRALAAGQAVADAARTAKLAAIRRGSPPATWAAFAVVGDPLVTVPLTAPANRWLWIAIALGLAVAGGLLYGVRRMRRAVDESEVPSESRAVTAQ